ncbi:glycosyl hydrolase family 8 [Flavitalea flava]
MSFRKNQYLFFFIMILPALQVFPVCQLSVRAEPWISPGASSEPFSGPPSKPFPQHTTYTTGVILPNHVTHKQMDDSVRTFYKAWKKRYLRKACTRGQYYIWFEGPDKHKQCVSEGQGYGMLIVALMAGYDDSARGIYDGLYRYYRAHPSKADPYLMAWAQKKDCKNVDGSSATDGDMDIAYSLLMANTQWGNQGPVHYLDEGRRALSAIWQQEINPKTYSVLLSNSVEHDSKDYFDMRSSDFMPAHFRAFKAAAQKKTEDARGKSTNTIAKAETNIPDWNKVVDNNYKLFTYLQETYSPEAGLFPDFISHIKMAPASHPVINALPARPHYLESRYDGSYNYNACRVPWRIATDYILNGDQRALEIIKKINRWVRLTTKDNPDNISAGYSLAGEDLKNRYYEAICFIGPFAVSAMAGKENQAWLNKVWDYMVGFRLRDYDYYDNSIKLIDMIILSGNYWAPVS